MKRQSTGPAFDLSIAGDELEAHRIQLEHNLQNTELSFHLSSDDGHYPRHHRQDSSLEYPRHVSEPSLPDFPSFSHRSREHFGDEEQSHLRGWSYRTGDDEEGINPYGGETVSTAAHHASALTLSAGLGGGRGARREVSLSAAEYDPDRPLHAMIAGVNSKHSMFDLEPSKNTAMGMTYDPLVVDSTAELDRILESGHAPPPMQAQARHLRPPSPISSASSSTSDSDARQPLSPASRPKLADHLRHVSFSPKRPRSGQAAGNAAPLSPFNRSRALPDTTADGTSMYINAPTPRASRQPHVRLQPATPSGEGSQFTRMARGIHKELEETQEQLSRRQAAPSVRSTSFTRMARGTEATQQQAHHRQAAAHRTSASVERNPFHDPPEPVRGGNVSTRRDLNASTNTTKGRIHLPDVTGLTAAVESPARNGTDYFKYPGNGRPRDSEVRLLQTLNAVQGQLQDLEEENGISRRRVRELEMELDECKREVARERTKLFEREEISVRHLHDVRSERGTTSKGKSKARAKEAAPEMDDARLHARYQDAVDEKKALEALITSLRTHLTRLTSELASHQALLSSLRQLRDADAAALRARSTDILTLKDEVQRLAGEVEVLRGVVEEGLKERRASREMSRVDVPEEERGMSQDLEEEEEQEEEQEEDELAAGEESAHEMEEMEESEEEEEEEEPEPFDPVSLEEQRNQVADRTMRTDFATLGESTNTRGRLVDVEELDDIAAELEERRSNLSSGSIRVRSPEPVRRNARATVEDVEDAEEARQRTQHRDQHQHIPIASQHARARTHPQPPTARPSAPTPNHAARRPGNPNMSSTSNLHLRASTHPQEPETPFPQIRGAQLERLFFSAPEHNAKTCTVCFRRRDRERGARAPSPSGWSRPRAPMGEREEAQHSDEGYEGLEGAEAERPALGKGGVEGVLLSGDMAQWRTAAKKHGVPPQTVVARVIRELEDDFTHYKSIYVELADQYKVMDAASDVRRRNTLAKHLREVVDILEQKGDQIASLYDLLQFKDKAASDSVVPERGTAAADATSWGGRAAPVKRR